MDAAGDAAQAVRTVVGAVHAGHDGQEHLCGADVARGAVALDVLFARLNRHAQGGCAGGIAADADQAARHAADVLGLGGDEGGVRPAEAHRHAEALGAANGDVGAPLAGRHEHDQGHRIAAGHDLPARGMRTLGHAAQLTHRSIGRGVRQQRAAEGLAREIGGHRIANDDRDAEPARAGLDDRNRLGVAPGIDEEVVVRGGGDRAAHRHRLGGGGALIQQRCTGERQARELGDHRLEVEKRLEPALGDLGLVGGVSGVPARVLEDVALDHAWHDRAHVAHADPRLPDLVLLRDAVECGQRLGLAALAHAERVGRVVDAQGVRHADAGGDRLRAELVERRAAERSQHVHDLGFARADVAPDERVGGREGVKGLGSGRHGRGERGHGVVVPGAGERKV